MKNNTVSACCGAGYYSPYNPQTGKDDHICNKCGKEFSFPINPPTEPNISLCRSCYCMTKTIEAKCGKCKADKVEPTVEKWEKIEKLWRFAKKPPTAGGQPGEIKPTKQIFFEMVIDLIAHSVQEARAEMINKIEKIMDKDRAKEIGDHIEIAFGERSCKVCGYNPEYQREYILASLKQEEEK